MTGPRDRAGGSPGRAERDRDRAGRPRNARPRDALGRPLPKSAAGEARVPDDLALAPAAALSTADQLLESGRPFHAHEVLEACWKAAPSPERDFWQGLAQLAVGLTHARRGNARGAVALLRRGAARVRPYAPGHPAAGVPVNPHGVDAAAIVRAAEDLADSIDRDGLAGIPPERLLFRLRAPAPDPEDGDRDSG